MLPIYSLEQHQVPSGQLLKGNSLSVYPLHQNPSTVQSYTFASLPHF